jgi:hypothetical protein
MAKVQTAKEQYDELISDLKAGTHRSGEKDRPVLEWAEYDVPAGLIRTEARPGEAAVLHPYAGKHVVTVQYGGHSGGDGGDLKDYVFNPDLAGEPIAPSAPPPPVDKLAVLSGASPAPKTTK